MSDFVSELGRVKRREETVDLTSTDLFDKIINLKFTRASGKSFVIRSDYEPVYDRSGRVMFKPCMYKPQIKVAYQQVSDSVAIKVDIEVTNLFIYAKTSRADKASATAIYTEDGDPVLQIIVQMGYRAQFPDWTDEVHQQPGYVDRFFDLLNTTANTEQEAKLTYRQITVEVLASWPSGYPPDQVSYFQGIIGTVRDGLRWKRTEEELAAGYGDENTPVINPETGERYGVLEWTCFNYITRRFVRSNVLHLMNVKKTVSEGENGEPAVEYETAVFIYGKNDYDGAAFMPGAVPDMQWTPLVLGQDGLMSEEDAASFGVVCRISAYLRRGKEEAYTSFGPEEFAGALAELRTRRFTDQQDGLGAQLLALRQAYNKIRWYQLTDGSFYIYSVDEGEDDLFSDPETLRRQANAIKLPAIYDISLSGLRTIRGPFIAFIGPMTTVLFKSRYSIGSLVGFYYHPGAGTDAFLVLQASVSFDTTGEENTMTLSCTDIPEPAAPEVQPDGSVQPKLPINEIAPQEVRNAAWIQVPKERRRIPTDAYTRTFEMFAYHYLWENSRNPETNESYWPEGEPTLARMLRDLKEWNPELFDGYKDGPQWQEPLYEDRRLFNTVVDFHIPNIPPGELLTFRIPYRPDYPASEEVTR
jgi:hypothetical protein